MGHQLLGVRFNSITWARLGNWKNNFLPPIFYKNRHFKWNFGPSPSSGSCVYIMWSIDARASSTSGRGRINFCDRNLCTNSLILTNLTQDIDGQLYKKMKHNSAYKINPGIKIFMVCKRDIWTWYEYGMTHIDSTLGHLASSWYFPPLWKRHPTVPNASKHLT